MNELLESHSNPDLIKNWRDRLTLSPSIVLFISIFLSFMVYVIFFLLPLYLPESFDRTRLDTRYLYWERPFAQVRLLVSFLVLGGLYLWGWYASKKARGPKAWILVIGGALLCAGALLWMTPFDAADIYDNIMHGRILGIYGGNPFQQLGVQFPNDSFFDYMAWDKSPSAYGPLWEMLAGFTARLAGDGIITNVLAFKLLSGIFWMGSLVVIALTLRRASPQQALPGAYLLGLNPLVLYATWGNGHNDIVMVFWILLAALLVYRRRFTTAILSLITGALIKYLPLLLVPVALVIALRALEGLGARLRFLLLAGCAALVLVWLSYMPFWDGLGTLTLERRASLYSSSLPAVAFHLITPVLGKQDASWWISRAAAILTLFFVLWRSWRARVQITWADFQEASYDIIAFYLLITCLWFQQWYAIWLVGLAAILPFSLRQRFAVFFSFAVLSKQLVAGPALLWPRPKYPQPELEIRFTLGVLGLPWLYLFASAVASAFSRLLGVPRAARHVTSGT